MSKKISRRDLIRLGGLTVAGAVVAACGATPTPTPLPTATKAPPTNTPVPPTATKPAATNTAVPATARAADRQHASPRRSPASRSRSPS